MMKYSEIERNLFFGFNLVSLKLETVAHEMKGEQYPYPEVHVGNIKQNFVDTYDDIAETLPARLKSSDIPGKFSSIIKKSDPIASLIMTLGYDIGFWWQTKFHGGEILEQLEQNLERISRDLNTELPGMKTRISDVIKQYRDIAFNQELTPDLLDQLVEQTALAIDEHFEKEREREGLEKELQYSLDPSEVQAFEKEFGDYRSYRDEELSVSPSLEEAPMGEEETVREIGVEEHVLYTDPDEVNPREDPEMARRILEKPQSRLTNFEHPFVLPLLPYLTAAKEKIPPDIKVLIDQYDLYLIKYSFGAMPRGKEKFTELDLYLDYPDQQGFLTHTLIPNTELEEWFSASVKGSVALNPNLEVGVPNINLAPGVGVGGGFRASTEAEFLLHWTYKVFRAKVIARGKNSSYAQWVIKKPERMVGDIDFSTVICVPKGTKQLPVTVSGNFLLNRKIKWWKKKDFPYKITAETKIVRLPEPQT